MNYEKMYEILNDGVTEVVNDLRDAIYSEKLSPSALRFMSDLKYYQMTAANYDRDQKRIEEFMKKKKLTVRPVPVSRKCKKFMFR